MTDPIDIVERLRTDVLWHERRGNETIAVDCREAAAEIIRLREELALCCQLKRDYAERAALAAQVPQPVAEFDHDIGADRYTVHRGAFWWHVRIGDSPANVGKFYTRNEADDMALKLLTAFRDGAFAQHRTAPGASPPPAALAVPDGWALVPVEPTDAMAWAGVVGLDAASSSDIDPTLDEVKAVYRAMLAASPQPPQTAPADTQAPGQGHNVC